MSEFNDRDLLAKITKVRKAISGEDGLWDTLQESIGRTVTHPDGSVFSYQEFCTVLIGQDSHVWFLRLMDFWHEIDRNYERLTTVDGHLKELEEYLEGFCSHRIKFFGREWIYGGP